MLEIKNLHASVEDKEILKGVDLTIGPGEIHAVMGPNGAGKSTLAAVLTGRPGYTVTEGSVTFCGKDLLAMAPEERAWAGLFLSFQYPIEIPGVTITAFMKAAVNAKRRANGLEELKAGEFLKLQKEKMAFLKMKPEFAKREVNVGFSGGEKKRNKSAIIVTHYHKLLEYVQPDFVHVLKDGRIVKTGGRELIDAIESEGFDQF